jgi:hypothetical protein
MSARIEENWLCWYFMSRLIDHRERGVHLRYFFEGLNGEVSTRAETMFLSDTPGELQTGCYPCTLTENVHEQNIFPRRHHLRLRN